MNAIKISIIDEVEITPDQLDWLGTVWRSDKVFLLKTTRQFKDSEQLEAMGLVMINRGRGTVQMTLRGCKVVDAWDAKNLAAATA